MSAAAQASKSATAKAETRKPMRKPRPVREPRSDWRRMDTADVTDLYDDARTVSLAQALDRLARAAERAPDRPLPQRARLEAEFDTSLDHVSAVWSHEIRSLLRTLGAKAAVIGDRMVLPDEGVSIETLRHETAHLLQSVAVLRSTLHPDAAHQIDAAEIEADIVADDPEAASEPLEASRPADLPLFRGMAEALQDNSDWENSQDYRAAARTEQSQGTNTQTANDNAAETQTSATPDTNASLSGEDAATAEVGLPDLPSLDETVPLEPPQLGGDAPDTSEAVAEAEAAVAEAVTQLDSATTPESYAAAFKAAPPSVKAERQPGYAVRMSELASGEIEAFSDTVPEPSVIVETAEQDLPEVAPITVPDAPSGELEAQAPAPAPEPDITPTEDAVPYAANDTVARDFGRSSAQTSPQDVARALGSVSVTDNEVETSPGPAPDVPLEGETDPERLQEQSAEARDQATTSRDAAMTAVVDGPGPEQVMPRPLEETVALELETPAVAVELAEPVAGIDEFSQFPLDPETQAVFDQAHGETMAASLTDAQSQTESLAEERDRQRDEAVGQAERDMAAAGETANQGQREAVTSARETIQTERRDTLEQQAAAVADVDADIAEQSRSVRSDIDARVTADEAAVQTTYDEATVQTESEVAAGERDAQRERDAADREAEDQSWWDQAVDWVKSQLSALTEAIGEIFDAVREVVGTILDAAKEAAFALIDAAATFIKDAISAYAEVLKAGIGLLVGTVFPELAETLQAAIDEGVRLAHQAVDAVAEDLKAGVAAIAEGLKAALDSVLSFIEGALNTIVAVVSAALSGDWAEVARLVIEPVLRLVGINPDDFYSYIGSAMETLGKIVSHPGEFLSNLLDAVVGGFRLFGDNFVDRLIQGVIGWLTGALGGDIEMPEQFDFWGILDIGRQVMGLTLDMMRRIAVRILGEAAVDKIEFFIGFVSDLISTGWGGLFDKIKEDLSGLAEGVIGQVTEFLTERLVKAGIVWLASLINPAGALVKLVLMIWDFIMWLKDNLGRLIEIVQTVVNGIIDIANGNLEPAKQAVDATLARLLPPTIDLLARLLGLGNVARRVTDIIGGIRQKIENAIVKFIRKVMARFTGRNRGRQRDSRAPDGNANLMTPIPFGEGQHSHTLYLAERGRDTVPMMRSTPTAVEDWLNTLKTDAGVKRQLEIGRTRNSRITDQFVAEKKSAIAPDVQTALQKEDGLDTEGDQAARAASANARTAAAEKRQAEQAARRLKTALNKIIRALGLTNAQDFKEVEAIKAGILTTRDEVKTRLNGHVNRKINEDPARKVAYSQLSWEQVKDKLAEDTAVLSGALEKPLHSDGVLSKDSTFKNALFSEAERLSKASSELVNVTAAELSDKPEYMTRALLPKLNSSTIKKALIKFALEPDTESTSALFTTMKSAIEESINDYNAMGVNEEDTDYKKNIKASAFKEGGAFTKRSTFTSSYKLKYYEDQDQTGPSVDKPLIFFLTKGSAGSKRAQKNISYTADKVREAEPGMHEWILSSTANQAIQATINSLESTGGTDEAEGFANFVQFQHLVRTPTNQLLFSPEYVAGIGKDLEVHMLRTAHISKVERGQALTAAEIASIKAKTAPAIQAHAGGLNMVQIKPDGSGIDTKVASQSASPRWHSDLQEKTSKALVEVGSLDLADMAALGKAITDFFEDTIFGPQAGLGKVKRHGGFGEYRFSAGGRETHTYAQIESQAHSRYAIADEDLRSKINKVLTQ